MFQEKIVISKKHDFFGQALVFWPLQKPGLYISCLYIFSIKHHELRLKGKQMCHTESCRCADVFMWILHSFKKHVFHTAPVNGAFQDYVHESKEINYVRFT